MIVGDLVPLGGPDRAAMVVVDDTGWWRMERTEETTGDGRRFFRASTPLTETDAVALVEATFPGTVDGYGTPVAIDDPAVELRAAVVDMLDHFAADNPQLLAVALQAMVDRFTGVTPERMGRPGWKRIVAALEPYAPSLDPTATGAPTGHTHPDTSRRAGRQVAAGTQQHALLDVVVRAGAAGVTSHEAAVDPIWKSVCPGITPNNVGARMLELRQKGLVMKAQDGGVIRERDTAGGSAEVHEATDRGRSELARTAS